MSEATFFIIKEITGPDMREIKLTSYALPFQPYELRGTLRAELTHYPGNPDATVQVLGPVEEPTTVAGAWVDRFLGDPNPIWTSKGASVTTAREAVRIIDDIRRKGQMLRVSWDETVRYGVMTEFVQRWLRGTHVEWEMSFAWVSQDRGTALSPVLSVDKTPQDVVNVVGGAILAAIKQNSVAGAASNIMGSAQQAVGTYRRALARMADLNAQAQGFVDSTFAIVQAPGEALQQTAGLLGAIGGQAKEALANNMAALNAAYMFEGTAEVVQSGYGTGANGAQAINPENNQKPTESGSSTGGTSAPASIMGKVLSSSLAGTALISESTKVSAAGKALAASVWAIKNAAAMRNISREATVGASTLLLQYDRDLIAIYHARADDDLRDVARIYYDDQRYWRELKDFNDIDGSLLTSGQVVLVPRLQAV